LQIVVTDRDTSSRQVGAHSVDDATQVSFLAHLAPSPIGSLITHAWFASKIVHRL
jgi:hypothetical protein